jgi:hypothetical protein
MLRERGETKELSPECAKATQVAFERVCRILGVGVSNHGAVEVVAASVMQFAKTSVYDADELSRAVLKNFKLLE